MYQSHKDSEENLGNHNNKIAGQNKQNFVYIFHKF
jgi:hypothetical protein